MKTTNKSRKTNLKHADYAMQYWLQLTLVILLGLMAAASLYFSVSFLFMTSPEGYEITTLDKLTSISSAVMPLMMLAAAYLLNPRQLRVVPRLLESGLLAIGGVTLMTLLSFVSQPLYGFIADQPASFQYANLGTMFLSLAVFIGLLGVMRATKHWR